MRTLATCCFASLLFGWAACGSLMADTVTIADLPGGQIDTLSIVLNPLNGAVDGTAGSTVGWGFTVTWTSTSDDWISFTSTSLGSLDQVETNPSLLASYTDFIGAQGGPVDFGLSPGFGSWTEPFDGVSQGVGAYQINSDPGVAIPGAQDTGEITFNFQVFNGDPETALQIGDSSYSYFADSTAFSVTVDASAVPEPGSWLLCLTGVGAALLCYRVRACRSTTR